MKLPAYQAHHDTQIPWLGRIPAHWGLERLKYCATILNEKTSAIESNLSYLRLENIESWMARRLVAEENIESGETASRFYPGDILFGKLRPYLAKVYECQEDGICTSELLVLQPRSTIAPFLKYQLVTTEFIRIVDSSTYGAKMPRANWEFIGNMPIPTPPLNEQLKVITFLDREVAKIDTLIAKQERLIKLLQEKRQALISHAVTKGLNPDAPMKDSRVEWLGEVPAHWEVKPLKHLAEVHTGVAKGRDLSGQDTIEVPYLRVANVQDGYLDLADVSLIIIAKHELPRYSLQRGDVLMNEGGDNDKLGRGHVWNGEIDPCIHQNHVFAVRTQTVAPEWLTAITSSDYAKTYFQLRAKQSTNLASISSRNLQELPIVLPPADERCAILSGVQFEWGKIDLLVAKVRDAVERLQERRAALISAAATGKIDVRKM